MGNHVVVAAALFCALCTPSLSLAATPSTETSARLVVAANASQCASLDAKWKIVEASCMTNANLGRARALARDAESKCKSSDTAQRKLGPGKYESALRLCRKEVGDH